MEAFQRVGLRSGGAADKRVAGTKATRGAVPIVCKANYNRDFLL